MEKEVKKETIFATLKLNTEIGKCRLVCSTDDLSVLFNIFRRANLNIESEIDFDFDEEEEINPDGEMLLDFIQFVNELKGYKCGIGLVHIEKYIRSKNKK